MHSGSKTPSTVQKGRPDVITPQGARVPAGGGRASRSLADDPPESCDDLKRRCPTMDLDSFLLSLYVLVDDWRKRQRPADRPKPGRPALLSASEVLTLAILAQWPRFRSERDFWRFAQAHLRSYFPRLVSQGQLNRRIRALEPELRALQSGLAGTLAEPSEDYRVMRPSSRRSYALLGRPLRQLADLLV